MKLDNNIHKTLAKNEIAEYSYQELANVQLNLWRYAIKSASQEVLFIAKVTTVITLHHERLSDTMEKLEFRQYASGRCV